MAQWNNYHQTLVNHSLRSTRETKFGKKIGGLFGNSLSQLWQNFFATGNILYIE